MMVPTHSHNGQSWEGACVAGLMVDWICSTLIEHYHCLNWWKSTEKGHWQEIYYQVCDWKAIKSLEFLIKIKFEKKCYFIIQKIHQNIDIFIVQIDLCTT
jgi:hypothetical protein